MYKIHVTRLYYKIQKRKCQWIKDTYFLMSVKALYSGGHGLQDQYWNFTSTERYVTRPSLSIAHTIWLGLDLGWWCFLHRFYVCQWQQIISQWAVRPITHDVDICQCQRILSQWDPRHTMWTEADAMTSDLLHSLEAKSTWKPTSFHVPFPFIYLPTRMIICVFSLLYRGFTTFT